MANRTMTVVLAAGEGTRMASDKPKVLHEIARLPMIMHVVEAAQASGTEALIVVVGPNRKDVAEAVRVAVPKAKIAVQRDRKGTAHAVLAAKNAIDKGSDLLVAFGDTPLVRPETFRALGKGLKKAAIAVLGFRAKNPTGYGRLIVDRGRLVAIREESDATEAERAITLCNAGVMALSGKYALDLLQGIGNRNKKQEFYLSDAVGIAASNGLEAIVIEASEEEVMGVNDKKQLSEAEGILQKRLRESALKAGVTLIAPDTVFLSADTKFGRDVVVEPNVVFGKGVVVGDRAVIRSFCHLEGARIGAGASVGPFARLRKGTDLGEDTKIGNFVETKAARFGKGSKANHLAYVGDASVGVGANIGAGTITCNYDGRQKHRTEIGKEAFIGTNSSLVAPVKIGDRAYIGSGSVIVENVPADALALGRGKQIVKRGWAKKNKSKKRKPKRK